MNRLGDLHRVARRTDMHIHHARRLMEYVVMERRLHDSTFLQFRHHGHHFIFGEHKIAHHHALVAHLLEGDPRAERKRRLDGHAAHSHLQVAAR